MLSFFDSEWGRAITLVIVQAIVMGIWWLVGDAYVWRICIMFGILALACKCLLARASEQRRLKADREFYETRQRSRVILIISPVYWVIATYLFMDWAGYVESKWWAIGFIVLFSVLDWRRYYHLAYGSRLSYRG